MSIKEGTKRARTKSRRGEHPKYRVPESAIRAFIEGLGIHDIASAAKRFQVIADITSDAVEKRIDQLDTSNIELIKQIAGERNDKRYRRIMKAISAYVTDGSEGINAAHLIAIRAIKFAFEWSREYVAALKQYRDRLRSLR